MKRWAWTAGAVLAAVLAAVAAQKTPATRGGLEFEAWIQGDDTGFAPNHVAAVWIEDDRGDFVATIFLRGYRQTRWLSLWKSAAKRRTPEAVTGATLTKFGKISATWDGRTQDGKVMPDGMYVVKAEAVWWNGNGNELNSIPFQKGPKPDAPDVTDNNGFKDIYLKWTPGAKTP